MRVCRRARLRADFAGERDSVRPVRRRARRVRRRHDPATACSPPRCTRREAAPTAVRRRFALVCQVIGTVRRAVLTLVIVPRPRIIAAPCRGSVQYDLRSRGKICRAPCFCPGPSPFRIPVSAIAIIPARYQSTRLPGKALADIDGRPMIEHVYRRAAAARRCRAVIVATDDERIARRGAALRRRGAA